LDISGIHPIEWNKSAFDRLVLDPKTKELITALVQVRIATGRAEDIIEGKGNGLMILLHGGPGTGKTLTAGML
jgi:DNA helicase TIP49 (TBP-interacting protein)